jgi:hypothetical protein
MMVRRARPTSRDGQVLPITRAGSSASSRWTIASRHWSRQAAIACLGSSCVSITAPLSHPPLTISALTRAAHEKNVSDPATGRELMLIVQAFGSGPERCCPRSSPPDAVRQCWPQCGRASVPPPSAAGSGTALCGRRFLGASPLHSGRTLPTSRRDRRGEARWRSQAPPR